MLGRIVTIGAMAAVVGACATETRTVVAEDVCASYGLRVDSPEYRKCQAREGRAGPGYTPAELMTASRAACSSYGIMAYTQQYERCVRNEYAYHSQG
jgi:hypothetical protein